MALERYGLDLKRKLAIILVLLLIATTYLAVFFLFLKEEWQEKEILNVVVSPYPLVGSPSRYVAVSVFADGYLHVAIGYVDTKIWRNSFRLGQFVCKGWPELNGIGYWQIIWRGSVQLSIIDWEERVRLSEDDFERIKELIHNVDRQRLSGRFAFSATADFLINTRRTRYYAQDLPEFEDDRAIELLDELLGLLSDNFYSTIDRIHSSG